MIRRALFWSFAAQLVSFTVMFGGSLIVARLLSPREMGIYTVSLATIGVLQIIAAFGVGNFVIRATDLDARMLDTAFTVNAVLGLSLGAAIFALSYAGAAFLSEPAVAQVMRLLALSPIISIFDFRPSNMLQREMQFKRVSVVGTAQALTASGVTIVSAFKGASYFSPAFGGLASAVVGVVGYSMLGRKHVAIRFSMLGWKPMAAFGFRMMSIGGVSNVAARLSDIIVGRMLGLAALGLFGRASNLSNLIFQNIYGTATRVIFAKMSKDYRETGQLRDTYLKGLRLIAAIMGPLLIGLAVLSKPAIQLMYGDKWQGAAIPLSFLMVAQFVTLRFAMNWELFVIKDELRVQTRIEITRSVASLVTRAIGSLFSVAAAAGAAVFDAFFSIALYGTHINRMIDVKERVMTRVSVEAVLLTVAAVLPSFVLMMVFDWNEHTPLPLIVGSVGLGILLWLSALAWTKHPLFDELTNGLAWAKQRSMAGRGGRVIPSTIGPMRQAIDRIAERERSLTSRVARFVVRGTTKTLRAMPAAKRWPAPFTRFVNQASDRSRAVVVVMQPESLDEPQARQVLLITHDLTASGAPKIVFEIAGALRAAGHGVTVMSPSNGPLAPSLVELGATLVIDPRVFDSQARTLRRLATAADAIVCNTIVSRDAVRIVHGLAPVLWYLHEVSLIEAMLAQGPSLPDDLALATELWCGSELSAQLVRAHRPDTKVVPYGLAPLMRQPHDDVPSDASHIRIGVFGSIEARKGQDLATAAIGLLPAHEQGLVSLVFYGRTLDARLRGEIERMSAGLPVRMGGELDADAYRQAMLACDVVLVPSRDDTLPLVSLDALGAGRILACTRTTGTAAYLQDGVNGFVAEAADAASIAAMLSRLLSRRDDWASIGEAGQRVFAAAFSREEFATKILSFTD